MTPSRINSGRVSVALRTALQPFSEVIASELAALAAAEVPALTRMAFAAISYSPDAIQAEALAAAIMLDRSYHRHLLDENVIDTASACRAAELLARYDSGFTAGLLRAADEIDGSSEARRALDLIEALRRTAVAAQWVRRMTDHPDPNVRSKAVKMLASLHGNSSLIERQLEATDARVRANAIEGLWGDTSRRSLQVLEKAARDPHHRVATNALIGLYLAGVTGATDRILQAAQSPLALTRAASAWAMGRTGCRDFVPALEDLQRDSDERVSSAAVRALSTLRKHEEAKENRELEHAFS